jgi:hypothetical protein
MNKISHQKNRLTTDHGQQSASQARISELRAFRGTRTLRYLWYEQRHHLSTLRT